MKWGRNVMKIGIVGCGNISDIYLKNLTTVFENTAVYAVCDLDATKANAQAQKYQIEKVLPLDEMLADPEIDIVLNITTPKTHYDICKKALLAGKHVYVEKPLSISYCEGKELLSIAKEKGLYIGGAPDTFLGAGIQTAISLIKNGAIGNPVGGAAYMMCSGHESWHPSPEFYYDIGGGPLFDMGPYYITALVRLLGPVKSVYAVGTKAFAERTITSKPKFGQKIPVKVDTHNVGILSFENGAVVTLVTSFDVVSHTMPNIEIYGTAGSLKVPDPNTFGGSVQLATRQERQFTDVPLVSKYSENSRGIGISEMVLAINENRINNASGELALHVLEIMEAFLKSSKSGASVFIESVPSPEIALDWNVEIGKLKTRN